MTETTNEKEFRVNRASLIRRIFLGLFPLVALFFLNWLGIVFTSLISVLAIFLDRTRNSRRAMPFLMYLVIVWGMQAMVLTLTLTVMAGDGSASWTAPALNLMPPEQAMEHWRQFDERNKLNHAPVVWNEQVYPWIKEFPPLSESDPAPVIKTASVILAAHNEHKYLERTINSIFEQSDPDQLIEIIVVDDASEPPLSEITNKMASQSFGKKVIILRHDSREGLIRSKSHGAEIAKGDLIIFLDAHVKPEKDWLKPLFRHTNENWKRVVVPVIPILNGETWTVDSTAVGFKMMFDWALGFNWFDDGNDWVPIMSGGLLAITRRYWHWSGEYDNGMLQWGGENIEQSIRIWLCGGEIVVARDSRVSHVFRPTFPYAINSTQVNINKVRLVEVWFDEYREFYYRSDPFGHTLIPHMGDVSQRLDLKKNLLCKPFQYFVDRFRSVFDMKHMLPKHHIAIMDEVTSKCLMAQADGSIRLGDCDSAAGPSPDPAMRFIPEFSPGNKNAPSEPGVLRSFKFSSLCFDANAQKPDKDGLQVLLYHCMMKNEQQNGWTLGDGALKWGPYCAFFPDLSGPMLFGKCVAESSDFLSKKIPRHPNHRFTALDQQDITIAKSDSDIEK